MVGCLADPFPLRLKPIMRDAVIVEAVRTPIGKRNGKLAAWHPVDLLAHTLRALIARSGIDPALVEDEFVTGLGECLNIP